MCENIALIKAVHENMSISEANTLAVEMLSMIGLQKIAYKRVENCSKDELLLVMFIRALMTKEKSVILKLPSEIIGGLFHIENILKDMRKVNTSKEIFVCDLVSSKAYYKECECHIEESN